MTPETLRRKAKLLARRIMSNQKETDAVEGIEELVRSAEQAAYRRAAEIEITPEMIEAGAAVLCSMDCSLADEEFWAKAMVNALVEAVARALDPEAWALWDEMQLERDRCDETLGQARSALEAVNASGTHMIIPTEIWDEIIADCRLANNDADIAAITQTGAQKVEAQNRAATIRTKLERFSAAQEDPER